MSTTNGKRGDLTWPRHLTPDVNLHSNNVSQYMRMSHQDHRVTMLYQAQANKGQALEGSYINKSLLALGSVINKLSEGGAAHVPFRDSKLTRLLQDSLTGSGARVAVICTVTPAASQAEETHSTLKFAARAKKVTSPGSLLWGHTPRARTEWG
jgi:hypothetical protein